MNEKMDLRIKKTYKALSESFKELSETKDFCDITVNEICENAMVGRGTFYKHFSNKHEFLSFLTDNFINECINKACDEAYSDNICKYFKAFFNNFIDAFETHKYNFKPADNYTAVSLAFLAADSTYNRLLEQLKNFYGEDDSKPACFTAGYLTIAAVIIIFDFMSGKNHNSDDMKSSIFFLLEKLFA